MLRPVARIISAIAVGLVLSIWIIQNSPVLQETVGNHIIQFVQKDWCARVNASKPRINFFTCSVYLENGTVTPLDETQCQWQFKECLVYVSPFALLTKREAQLHITLNQVTATTRATTQHLDIINHIKRIIKPSPNLEVRVAMRSLTINNIDATLEYGSGPVTCKIPGTFRISNDQDYLRFRQPTWHGSVSMEDALFTRSRVAYAHHLRGIISFYLDQKEDRWHFSTRAHGKLPAIDPAPWYSIDGTWTGQSGQITLTDNQQQTRLAGTFSLPLTVGLKGAFPANHLKNIITLLATNQYNDSRIGGRCTVDTVIVPYPERITSSGSFALDDLRIGNLHLRHLGLRLVPNSNQLLQSTVEIDQSNAYGLTGCLAWNVQDQLGSLTLTNTHALQPPAVMGGDAGYQINPSDCRLTVTCDTEGICKGSYACTISNQAQQKSIHHAGLMAFKQGKIAVKGSDARGQYAIKAAFVPHPHLTSIQYSHRDLPLVNCRTSKAEPFTLRGNVSWHFLKRFLDQQTRRMIFSSRSAFAVALHQEDPCALRADLQMNRGTLYMPEYHNVLTGCACSLTLRPAEKQLEVDNCSITLSKGTISCPHAVAQLDDDNKLKYVMAPLTINNLFVNWKKDFYGFVYGNLTLQKPEDGAAMLAGTLVLKKSLLKDAFLRGESSTSLYGPLGGITPQLPFPLGFDLKLVTERPVRAKTASFDAQARVDLAVVSAPQKDFFASPVVTGSIDLEKGSLRILNKSLAMQYGKIQFLHNNLHDPLVDLLARSRIGKYLVSLQATGSLQKPTILLESTPALSEEQIISLLLTGSEVSSLQADLPAMLLQNLDALIFSAKRDPKQQVFIDTLTKTFKYVQITPNLDADKNERGILRGSVSVNLTDQLRAKIDKDLDMEKNFSAQIEYLLADNINLKLVQEQRGERGVELEFRIKP